MSCRFVEETIRNTPCFDQGFTDIVVVPYEDHYLGKVPIAYFVPKPGATTDTRTLRRMAKTRLPTSHLPYHFVEVDQIQRSPGGKVIRGNLPKP